LVGRPGVAFLHRLPGEVPIGRLLWSVELQGSAGYIQRLVQLRCVHRIVALKGNYLHIVQIRRILAFRYGRVLVVDPGQLMLTSRDREGEGCPIHLSVPDPSGDLVHKQGKVVRLLCILTADPEAEGNRLILPEVHPSAHLTLGVWSIGVLRASIVASAVGLGIVLLHHPVIEAVARHAKGAEFQSSTRDVQRLIQSGRRHRFRPFGHGHLHRPQRIRISTACKCRGIDGCCRNGNAGERHQQSDERKYRNDPFHKMPPFSCSYFYERS